ncbi:CbiQ family ECF transporter T component [Isosphaeraceae bacterium EP7]
MRLEFDSLDRSASIDAPLQRLDARFKLVAALVLIVLAVATPMGAWALMTAQGLVLAFLAGLSGVPPWTLLRRWLGMLGLVAFFAVLVAGTHPERETLGRATVAASILGRNALATLTTLLLVHVTTTRALFGGMRRLGVPAVMVTTLQLMVRYLAVFADELSRMLQARRARSFRRRGNLGPAALASLISVLFLRAVERGDRVHNAMMSRGWDGTWRTLDGPEA